MGEAGAHSGGRCGRRRQAQRRPQPRCGWDRGATETQGWPRASANPGLDGTTPLALAAHAIQHPVHPVPTQQSFTLCFFCGLRRGTGSANQPLRFALPRWHRATDRSSGYVHHRSHPASGIGRPSWHLPASPALASGPGRRTKAGGSFLVDGPWHRHPPAPSGTGVGTRWLSASDADDAQRHRRRPATGHGEGDGFLPGLLPNPAGR